MVDKTECSIDGTDVWQTDDDDDVITEPAKSLLLSSFIPNTMKIHDFTQKHTNQLHNGTKLKISPVPRVEKSDKP